jgi:hypothetical protein
MVRGIHVPIPDDFLIPTCCSCGEMMMAADISTPLDSLLWKHLLLKDHIQDGRASE